MRERLAAILETSDELQRNCVELIRHVRSRGPDRARDRGYHAFP
jgi:hypothetical protein